MSYVYLIQSQETTRYKIGVSKNPEKRLKQLQTGNSEELKLIHKFESDLARKIEKTLHNTYSSVNTRGEWFEMSLSNELVFIDECKRIENNLKFLIESGNIFV